MKVIGLTGGIASGKSTVSLLLKYKGAAIIDADKISKKLMEKGTEVWRNVVKYFGKEILINDGNIDRKKLGQIVFSDKEALKILNNMTHPAIINEIKKQLEYLMYENKKVIIIDAALLLEIGLDRLVDEVWVVALDQKTQLERLMKREKTLSLEQAIARIKAQMPLQEKVKYAKRIIDNSQSIEHTRIQVDNFWREITKS